jgi:pimeloyl-[acyl-carrier protein] methyl ester esterase
MKTLVLLHGWGMNASVFDELSARLADRYDVHAVELSGYNGSPPITPYALEQLAADIAAKTRGRCYVAGWSLGAQVALAWARARPAQVERLALLGATPCFSRREDWRYGLEPAVLYAFRGSLAGDREGTLRRFISLQARGDCASKRVRTRLRAALAAHATPPTSVLEQGLRILAAADLRSVLSEIAQPALVVHGGRDELVPLGAAEYLAHALARARLAVVQGAAHAPFISAPDTVSALIAEHLA